MSQIIAIRALEIFRLVRVVVLSRGDGVTHSFGLFVSTGRRRGPTQARAGLNYLQHRALTGRDGSD